MRMQLEAGEQVSHKHLHVSHGWTRKGDDWKWNRPWSGVTNHDTTPTPTHNTPTLPNRPVSKYRTTAPWLEPYTVYYLKHQGPNLSLWRAHHRRTSFMKCTFHAACRRDQSSSSLARFSLFSFPAPIPTDKMSQFKPNGSPIKITRVSEGDRQGERDSYSGWVSFGQVGSN